MNALNVCACQGCPNTYTPDKNGTHKFCSTPCNSRHKSRMRRQRERENLATRNTPTPGNPHADRLNYLLQLETNHQTIGATPLHPTR